MRTRALAMAVLGAAGCVSAPVADSALSPGLWEIRNTPGVASLDGKELNDLPLPTLEPERVCLSPAQAADPASFLAGDTAEDCRITSATAAGGKVRIQASCPSPDAGREGSMLLTGRYRADSYEVDFATTAYGANGRMTFSGKLVGRRLGDCPAT